LAAGVANSGKKYEAEINSLKVQLAGLQQKNQQAERALPGLKETITSLTTKNAELAAGVANSGKKYEAEINSLKVQLAGLQQKNQQAERALPGLKDTIASLTTKNAELAAGAANSGKKYESEINSLKVQLAGLQQRNQESASTVPDLKESIISLTKKNAELVASAENSEKKLKADIQALKNQLAGLQHENQKSESVVSGLKETIASLKKNNAELSAGAVRTRKKYEVDITTLKSQLSVLQQENKKNDNKDNQIHLISKSDKYSYALGVLLFETVSNDISSFRDSTIKINLINILAGINDEYDKKSLMSKSEASSLVSQVDKDILSKKQNSISKIKKEIKGLKYKEVSDGVFMVVNKKGIGKFIDGEIVTYDVFEKTLSNKVIMNNVNNHIKYGVDMPPFLRKAINNGLKGGKTTIYGLAGIFYESSNIPYGVTPDTPIKLIIETR
jgi:chromosome segregation ATPase